MQSRWMRYGLAAAVGVALLIVRTWGISETFQLFGDQMRDWDIALGRLRDLPLSGPPTYAGGRTWGPEYYWTLWTIRHLVGPFVQDLPHAGGIGQSILQSIADSILLLAIWRRLDSLPLALGAVLLIATYPEDLALSATIWNPPMAVAFLKLTMAVVLMAGPAMWWALAAGAAAWFTVDMHLSTILVAVPVMAAFVWRELAAKRWRRGVDIARAFVEIVAVFEIPYVLDQIYHPSVEIRPVLLGGYIGSLHPLTGLSLALHQVTGFFNVPVNALTLTLTALLVGVAAVAARRDVLLMSVTIAPIAAMAAMLAVWQGRFFGYWLMTLVPPAVLMAAVALHAIPGAVARRTVAFVFLVAVLAVAPGRIAESQRADRMPGYGTLVRGSQQIRRRTATVARIDVTFDIGRSNSEYLYERVLGGTIDPAAQYIAEIDAAGTATYSANPNAPGASPRDR